MRKPVDITRGYQLCYMLLGQVIISLVLMLMQFFMVIGSFNKDGVRIFVGIITTVVYFIYIAVRACNLTKSDKKSYTPLNASIKWAVIWGLSLVIFNILLIVIYKLFGAHLNSASNGVLSIIISVLFYILQSPFLAFTVKCLDGNIPILLMALITFMPFISTLVGYYFGINEIAIVDKINSIVFENDHKSE